MMASKRAGGGLPPLPRRDSYLALRMELVKVSGMNKEHGAKWSAIGVLLGTAIVLFPPSLDIGFISAR